MQEFVTTPKDTEEDEDRGRFPFKLDGDDYVARKPKKAAFARTGAINSRRTNIMEKIQIALDFIEDCLEEPGRTRLRGRLLDEDDDFDVEDVIPILTAMSQEWAPETRRSRRGG